MIEAVEPRLHLHAGHAFHAAVSFQPTGVALVQDFVPDTGQTFALRTDGLVYGWDANNSQNARKRSSSASLNLAYDTFNHMQLGGSRKWELSVPNGRYDVRVVAGDASYFDSVYKINVEGTLVVNGTPNSSKRWVEGTSKITVTDGRLTVTNAAGSVNNKISFIRVALDETAPAQPEPPPPATSGWSAIASLPLARTEAMNVSKNGMLYVFGGFFDNKWDATKRVDVYNSSSNSWSRLPDMPVAITHAATVMNGDNAILVGGYAGNHPGPATSDVWNYNTQTRVWSKLPSLPDARGAGGAGIVGSQLIFFGGAKRLSNNTSETDFSNTWSLDLNNTSAGWKAKAALPNPRNHLGYATTGGKIYAIGGQYRDRETSANQTSVHVYDPTGNKWSSVASLPMALGHIQPTVNPANGTIVVGGGVTNGFTNTNRIHVFSPSQNRWTVAGTLPAPRKSISLAFHGNTLIFAGGGNNLALATGFKTTWSTAARVLPAGDPTPRDPLFSSTELAQVVL
ncbi:MAG TPA: kelch repeat-containing protein [Tepidisphaeraceae bacterium]|mgnify:CR=1 FL=1|nr:kelch repeat-containing protein [Tepidisphaeraceae bacterium]